MLKYFDLVKSMQILVLKHDTHARMQLHIFNHYSAKTRVISLNS